MMIAAKTGIKILSTAVLVFGLGLGLGMVTIASGVPAKTAVRAAEGKTFAQALVEDMVVKHSELAGLELATTPPNGKDCITIAATDVKELNDKCDKGELEVIRSDKATVEKEEDGYDVTAPLHVGGKVIGFVGMDFKPGPGQQDAAMMERGLQIAKDVEAQIPSKSKLFEPAK